MIAIGVVLGDSLAKEKGKYVTISIPAAIADEIDGLIGELGYWPSRGAFVREACLEKVYRERERIRELRKSESADAPIDAGLEAPPGD